MPITRTLSIMVAILSLSSSACGEENKPVSVPTAPSILPGKGLIQHDFFYAGEAKTRDMYIVRGGKIVWSYHDPEGRGEISDASLLPNGNVLLAHQFRVALITPEKKVVWEYMAPPKTEIHTAQMMSKDRVFFIQNGNPAKLMMVNVATGNIDKEFILPVGNPLSTHGQFRHARYTTAGTFLVAHMDMKKVSEYDISGKQIWSFDVGATPWSAERLKNGNTLITGTQFTREVNALGETVWELTASDVAGYKFDSRQIATRLPNGNTLINNWVNQWSDKFDSTTVPVQALEVTPDKKIVWALRAWDEPANLGPATTIQLLD